MNRLLFALLIACVAGGLGLGFMAVGGPGYARMERNDTQRLQDLRALGMYHRCLAEEVGEAEAAMTQRCSGHRQALDLRDPLSGAPYAVAAQGETRLDVCAQFETDVARLRGFEVNTLFFDGQTGCLRFARADAQSEWVQQ